MRNHRFFTPLLAAMLVLASSSCSKKIGGESPDGAETTTTTILVTEPPTEPPLPVRDRTTVNPETEHILDDCNLLDTATLTSLNEYADWLSHVFLLQVTVVFANQLDGESPAAYAEAYYHDLYASGSNGVLLLLNQETGEDYLYTSGTATLCISGSDKEALLITISPMLVLNQFTEAVTAAFELVERNYPEHIADQTATLTLEELNALNAVATEIAAEHSIGLTAVYTTEPTQAQADALLTTAFPETENAVVLLLNPDTGDCFVSLSGAPREKISGTAQGAMLDKILSAYTTGDAYAAVEKYYQTVSELLCV